MWSDESIRPGESIAAEIQAAIEAADAVVILLSRHALESQWTWLEIAAAIASRSMSQERNKRVIPVLVEPGVTPPPTLANVAYVDLSASDKFDSQLQALIDAIETKREGIPEHETRELERTVLDAQRRILNWERENYAQMNRSRQRFADRLILSFASLTLLVSAAVALIIAKDNEAVTAIVSLITALIGLIVGFYVRGIAQRDDQ